MVFLVNHADYKTGKKNNVISWRQAAADCSLIMEGKKRERTNKSY
jgi:hypothetical protein